MDTIIEILKDFKEEFLYIILIIICFYFENILYFLGLSVLILLSLNIIEKYIIKLQKRDIITRYANFLGKLSAITNISLIYPQILVYSKEILTLGSVFYSISLILYSIYIIKQTLMQK